MQATEEKLLDRLCVSDTTVYQTNDYSLFKLDPLNRTIRDGHVRSIEESMEQRGNLLPLYPIIVTAEGAILDGQHRYLAARNVGCTLYYVISDLLDISDVADLNTLQKGWRINDYVQYYADKEVQDQASPRPYVHLRAFCGRFDLPVTYALELLQGSGGSTRKNELRSGKMSYPDAEQEVFAIKVAKIYKQLRDQGFQFLKSIVFVRALKECLRHPEFDTEIFWERLERQRWKLGRQPSKEDYLRSIQDIYNHHVPSEHRINLIGY